MLPKNESEPFLKESDEESDHASRWKSSLERQNIYGRLGVLRHWPSALSPLVSHCMVFIATSLLWGSLLLFLMHISPQIYKSVERFEHSNSKTHGNFTSEAKLLTCGHSTPEAKNLGCQYDILSNHWVPELYMDQEAVKEYQTWMGHGSGMQMRTGQNS
jgi:hypothetical protein